MTALHQYVALGDLGTCVAGHGTTFAGGLLTKLHFSSRGFPALTNLKVAMSRLRTALTVSSSLNKTYDHSYPTAPYILNSMQKRKSRKASFVRQRASRGCPLRLARSADPQGRFGGFATKRGPGFRTTMPTRILPVICRCELQSQ